ncbi:MAG: class I SAM-dependent methyltransferase [Gemmatimonadales bacterium]
MRQARALDPSDIYLAFHARRYAFALETLAPYVAGPATRLLDIGPSKLTGMLHQAFRAPVDTLGFPPDSTSPIGRHYRFDLNDTEPRDRWRRDLPAYDIVVMAEVLEHLHVSPTHVLAFLQTLLRPRGILLIQTPNAVALHKRLEMLIGRHPYELLRDNSADPGHFREYTASELRDYARAAGFAVERCVYASYFDYRFGRHRAEDTGRPIGYLRLMNFLYAVVPPRFKPGLSLVLRLTAGTA